MPRFRTVPLLVLLAALGAPSRGEAPAGLRAVVEGLPAGSGLSECSNDTIRMAILAGDREILSREYCSAYAQGTAQVVTDRQDRPFVLLEYAEGKGSHATSRYLRVYELKNREILDRGHAPRSRPIGFLADLEYEYAIVMPPEGGIILTGVPRVTGELRPDEAPPPDDKIVMTIE